MTVIKDDDKRWRKLRAELKKMGRGRLTVGVHSKEGDTEDGDLSMAALASVHEFGVVIDHPGGTPHKHVGNGEVRFLPKGAEGADGHTKPHQIVIPERSFMRSTIDENIKEYGQITGALVSQWMAGAQEYQDVYKLVGMKIKGDIQQKIVVLDDPPNAPSTQRKKAKEGTGPVDNPLIDSGRMRQSIDYVFEE